MKVNTGKIKLEMKRLGINNEGLGDRVGITRQAIDYILANKTTKLSTLNKIAKVFEISARDLLI